MSRTISAGYVYRQYSTEGVYIADIKAPEPLMRRQGFPLVPSQELPTVNAGQAAVMSGERYWQIRRRIVLK